MPFNINNFTSNGLVYGGARPSLFDITLSVPSGIGIQTASVSKFTFVARGSSLPASKIAPFDVPYFGRRIKLAGDRTFDDWEVEVMNDEDFAVRSLFESWSNSMNRIVSNVRDPAVSEELYKVDMTINQYAKDGELIRAYTMYGAWPTTIGAIQTSWESANAVEVFSVGFAYDYWLPTVETSTKNAGGQNSYATAASDNGPFNTTG